MKANYNPTKSEDVSHSVVSEAIPAIADPQILNAANIPPAPERVIVRSKSELYEKLEAGLQCIRDGNVIDADVVMENLRAKYGFQD